MAKRTKKAGAAGDDPAAAGAPVDDVNLSAAAAKSRKKPTPAVKVPAGSANTAPKASRRRPKAAPLPDGAEEAVLATDTPAAQTPATAPARDAPAPDAPARDAPAPRAPAAKRRARRKGDAAASDERGGDATPGFRDDAVAPHAPAMDLAADEGAAQHHPADRAVLSDADTAGDTVLTDILSSDSTAFDAAAPDPAVAGPPAPAQQPDADKQARRAARQAERQAAREAERSAAKAARQAERQAAQAARKAARRNPRHGLTAPHGTPADQTPPDQTPPDQTPADQTPAEPTRPDQTRSRPARAADAGPRPADTADAGAPALDFDVLIVAQGGGIDREAAILAASLRRNAPGFRGRLVVAEPQPGGAWDGTDPRMGDDARAALTALGADIRPFEARDFGRSYPHGNKIEALGVLEPARPFLFLDSDTLVLGDLGRVPFDFSRPSASMRRSGTWPQPPAYNETYASIWRSLYDRFGLDFDATLDRSQPDEHWERFLYFNAGWFFGADPAEFGRRFRDWAVAVRDDPGEPLACQSLDPWLDQVILPLVIHSLGGGRPGPELHGMDGGVTCHWRNLPLLYAREPDPALDEMEAVAAMPEIAPLLAGWEPAERLIGMGQGRRRIRPMFWADDPPQPEQAIRHRLRQAGFWLV